MHQASPLVSIIMPVYNAGDFLSSAIQSILDQTFTDFELLIIDDGSTDNSASVIRQYTDSRIIFSSQANKGLTGTLNDALSKCRGTYIARMDQDDISEPQRIAQQVAYLEQHPEIGVLGTTTYIMTHEGRAFKGNPTMLNNDEIQLQLLYQTPFSHGSIMFRRGLILSLTAPIYEPINGNAEDYGLWSRLAQVTNLANIVEPLYGWRDNPTGMTNSGATRQQTFAKAIAERNLSLPHFQKKLAEFRPNFSLYTNETIDVHGTGLYFSRRDSYTYLVVSLAKILWKKSQRARSLRYFAQAMFRHPAFFIGHVFHASS